MEGFVHLHTHSEYSLLDGAVRVRDLVREAALMGMPAVAITDHGVMYAAVEFYKEAKEKGIKPILGFEAYVATRHRFDKVPKLDDDQYHLVLLAENNEGYKNLVRLCSRAHLEGFYYKPRVDRELLERHHQGLIVLSGCVAGEIPVLILAGKNEEALRLAGYYKELLGKDNFFLELQDHGLPEQKLINRELVNIAGKLGLGLVATNDVHYLKGQDAFVHDVLLCIQTGKTINEENRLRFPGQDFYFKSPAQMWELFREVPEALRNTLHIAERCQVEFDFSSFHLPHFEVPSGETAEEYLCRLAYQELDKKFPNCPEEVKERLDYELKVINNMGFAGYFLIVQDLVNWARKNGIAVGPGRGSAAGSLVSYLLSITTINPLSYGLLFERFLNPERISMPDIDVDFCFEKRDKVIDYIISRYGSDKVAQIITFGTMAARAAIRDVGRALDYPYQEVDRIARLIPAELGVTLERSLEMVPELKDIYERDYRIRRLIDTAKALEGMPRHASVHAAGVVIGKEELAGILPLQKTADGHVVTQFPKETVEEIGLLKMDILGLRTLTVIQKTIELVEKVHGKKIELDQIPLDDPHVYNLLSRGETVGVFQLESEGLRRLLTEVKPNRFEDLIAVIALYRPGPLGSGMVEDFISRKHGKQNVHYLDPRLEPILAETYGVILYQEQVMRMASELASFSLAEADMLRRAMGKKKPAEIKKMRDKFVEGAVKNGIPHEKASYLFDLMENFAGYGFNKSHSAAYALISYQTAYLKTYYPVEYMAAFLSSVIDNQDRVVYYIKECRRMGIKMLPPDINESYEDFTVVHGSIRFGLGAIRNVGEAAVKAIISAREKGRFKGILDFCLRVDLKHLNKRVMENLIYAGCFDSLGLARKEALQVMEACWEMTLKIKNERNEQQLSLFNWEEEKPKEPLPLIRGEFSRDELLRKEREALGFYVSSNPLDDYREVLPLYSELTVDEVLRLPENSAVKLVGLVSGIRKRRSKKGEVWLTLGLEDYTGKIEVVVFSAALRENGDDIEQDGVVLVEGRLVRQEEEVRVIARTINKISKEVKEFHVKVKQGNGFKEKLIALLEEYPGQVPVYIHLPSGKMRELNREYWVQPNIKLKHRLEEFCGPGNAWYA